MWGNAGVRLLHSPLFILLYLAGHKIRQDAQITPMKVKPSDFFCFPVSYVAVKPKDLKAYLKSSFFQAPGVGSTVN